MPDSFCTHGQAVRDLQTWLVAPYTLTTKIATGQIVAKNSCGFAFMNQFCISGLEPNFANFFKIKENFPY